MVMPWEFFWNPRRLLADLAGFCGRIGKSMFAHGEELGFVRLTGGDQGIS
jgi:hypothetical protein